MAAGAPGGAYLEFAKEYRAQLVEDGVSLEILETSGSIENLTLLASGKADAAFLQGGIADSREYPDLLGLGSLYYEPLWVFTRQGFELENLCQSKAMAGCHVRQFLPTSSYKLEQFVV